MTMTRRNVMSGIAFTAISSTVIPQPLEARLAAMSRDELEDYYIDRLKEIMDVGVTDIYKSPRRTAIAGATQVVLIDRRDKPSAPW